MAAGDSSPKHPGIAFSAAPVPPPPASPSQIAIPKSALNNNNYQQQRGYYYASSSSNTSRSQFNNNSNPASGQFYHSSVVANHSPSFPAASLPRTSSLLPPPHRHQLYSSAGTSTSASSASNNSSPATAAAASAARTQTGTQTGTQTQTQTSKTQTPPLFRNPFNAQAGSIAFSSLTDPVTDADPFSSSRRRPSRSSSVGGVSDSLRNLNRWSASTVSSRTSNPTHRKTASFGRRLSVDAVALQTQPSASPPVSRSPRKLQKSRPSTAVGESPKPGHVSNSRVRHPSPSPVPPLTSLPPIITLPSLEQEVRVGSPPFSGLTAPPRPSYLRRSGADDRGSSANERSTSALDPFIVVAQPERAGTTPTGQAGAAADSTAMHYERNGEGLQPRGYTRARPPAPKATSADASKSRSRPNKPPSQKAMLSKALQKAKTAVQLDNAGNIEGARQAYVEACELLQQVLLRTPGEEDKRKLEAIRTTYGTRIEELDQLGPLEDSDSRPLPRRPESGDHGAGSISTMNEESEEEEVVLGTAKVTRIYNDEEREPRSVPSYSIPISTAGKQSVSVTTTAAPSNGPRYGSSSLLSEQYTLQSSFSKSPRRDPNIHGLGLQLPDDSQYMPPPLSPRRPSSPNRLQPRPHQEDVYRSDVLAPPDRLAPEPLGAPPAHSRGNSHGSISWLDPIDESGGSAASSVHSRTSSMGIRRRHIRAASGDTEAEFDAALDDAIEFAYDDGYEPADPVGAQNFDDDDVVAKAMRRVELAKERVRESEREVLALANERERRLREREQEQELLEHQEHERHAVAAGGETEGFYVDGNDTEEEEERFLEEMTHGYGIEDFSFGRMKKKPSVPRASDSSEFTNRTWHSSLASNPPTANTILSTVAETTAVPSLSKGTMGASMAPPPMQSLPELPLSSRPPAITQSPIKEGGQTVRSRRMSGQNPKQLKIETTKLTPPSAIPAAVASSTTDPSSSAGSAAATGVSASASSMHPPRTAGFIAQQRQALSVGPKASPFPRQVPSPAPGTNHGEAIGPPPTPPHAHGGHHDAENRSGSPSVSRPGLRKNFSSSSLKSIKGRNMSVTNFDDGSDMSPSTPHSHQFAPNPRLPAIPSLPTPIATSFRERLNAGGGTGGLYLFDNDIHSPTSPGSPNPMMPDGPAALEPCPSDCMLRPFWLMRCLYQTLAHSRGGYLSNKLFVPRSVWNVKGVKLKNIDEKISNCDLLTAALMKLAKVDTCDADAVLDEMQSLEAVLEQVQAALTRKLGSEVGVQGVGSLFKDATNVADAEPGGPVPRSGSVSGKSSSFSWRRLRSKNSSAGLGNAYTGTSRRDGAAEGSKEGPVLASLPMTTHPTSKPAKRDVASLQFSGPNANYMGALARLFDAAQTIDQIARQVDDPGLRHADKTQVGLELCTRHAAEFFGFYICRFVLTDLSMLLDKFVKRGSEWVLV